MIRAQNEQHSGIDAQTAEETNCFQVLCGCTEQLQNKRSCGKRLKIEGSGGPSNRTVSQVDARLADAPVACVMIQFLKMCLLLAETLRVVNDSAPLRQANLFLFLGLSLERRGREYQVQLLRYSSCPVR